MVLGSIVCPITVSSTETLIFAFWQSWCFGCCLVLVLVLVVIYVGWDGSVRSGRVGHGIGVGRVWNGLDFNLRDIGSSMGKEGIRIWAHSFLDGWKSLKKQGRMKEGWAYLFQERKSCPVACFCSLLFHRVFWVGIWQGLAG